MSTYLAYYAVILVASLAAHNPYLLALLLGVFVLRDFIPDPASVFRAVAHAGRLRRVVAQNPANLIARRDLGRIYLDLRLSRAALRVLEEARGRAPKDQEIAYLHGIALFRLGRYEEALESLRRASGIGETGMVSSASGPAGGPSVTRTSEVLLLVATVLERLKRDEQAEQALQGAAEFNSSAIEPLVRLARLRASRGDSAGKTNALNEVSRTWGALPAYARRHQWSWYLRGVASRVL